MRWYAFVSHFFRSFHCHIQETPTDNIANAINNTTTDNRNYFLFILTLSPGIINDEDATQQTLCPGGQSSKYSRGICYWPAVFQVVRCVCIIFITSDATQTHDPQIPFGKSFDPQTWKFRWILLFTWCTLQTLGMHLTKIVAVSSHNEQYTQFSKDMIWDSGENIFNGRLFRWRL